MKKFAPLGGGGEQILYFKKNPHFGRVALSKKTKRKSQKLFVFENLVKH